MTGILRRPFALPHSLVDLYGRDLAIALATAALLVAFQLGGYLTVWHETAQKERVNADMMHVVELNRGLNEAQDALSKFAIGGNAMAIENHRVSVREAEVARDALAASPMRSHEERNWIAGNVTALIGEWERVQQSYDLGRSDEAVARVRAPENDRVLRAVRRMLRTVLASDRMRMDVIENRAWLIQTALFWAQIAFAGLMLWTLSRSVANTRKEALARVGANQAEAVARRRLELLFQMHDMLQSAEDHDDANAILIATASQLAPTLGGTLYIFNNSGDRLQLSTTWNVPEGAAAATIMPSDCWALKRGKVQHNSIVPYSLRCPHAQGHPDATLEIPMVARGQVLGMLILSDPDDTMTVEEAGLVGSALADGMSLALANIALRERLRNQALRDGLTGLYNRRYMEDVLDRFVEVAKNGGPETALIMIDLDHFKSINDEHGHAAGDAILREVGAAMMASLRKSDVACRYGGEELAIILPGCTMATAVERANMLRARIEMLSDRHGFRISASFGVATVPTSAGGTVELMAAADRALYAAKAAGRNQVHADGQEASVRRGARALQDKLAAA